MQTYNQNNFTGGLQAFFDPLKQPPETYPLLINGRNRDNVIRPIRKPLRQELPAGKKQGLYAVGRYLIAFVAGRAYTASTAGPLQWDIVPGFQMSDTADEIHFVAVPGSTANLKRNSDFTAFTDTPISGSTPVGLAFDGETQPWVVYPYEGGVRARATSTYTQWQKGEDDPTKPDMREYVPIGKYPLWHGNRLYIVAKDANGAWTQILRSVTGRPLDFMVNITSGGDKQATEAEGGAKTVGHAVSHEDITGLFATPSEAFVVSTLTNSYMVTPLDSVEQRVFMEPTFENTPLFPSGAVGHYAAVDISGDFCVISQSGIHSFNAVMQLRRESQNLPLSKPIWKYVNRPLSYGSAIRHDDYAFFAVDTTFGPGVLVYDTTTSSWAAIDICRGVGKVKQFAETVYQGSRRLWFISDEAAYEFGAGDGYEMCRFYVGDFNSQSARTCVRNPGYTFLFKDITETAEVCLRHFTDRMETETLVGVLPSPSITASAYPHAIPYDDPAVRTIRQINFDPSLNKLAFAFGAELSWASGAALSMLTVQADQDDADASLLNQESGITSVSTEVFGEARLGFFSDAGMGAAHQALVRQMVAARYDAIIGGGDHFTTFGTVNPVDTFNLWPTGIVKQFVPSAQDLYNDIFWSHFPRVNYRRVDHGPISFFLLHAGYSLNKIELLANTDRVAYNPDVLTEAQLEQQRTWLRESLKRSRARFNIVVVNTPPHTSDATYYPGYPVWRLPFKEWGAHLVLSGRSSAYERMSIDGVQYIACSTGRTSSALSTAYAAPGRAASKAAVGHVQIYANATKLTTAFIDATGAAYDRHTILT